jgi:tetratricopeptide (TPR) repeat protein
MNALDGVSQNARTRFERGLSAYQQGQYRAAIEHFKEADRLAPSARLSFNVALVYERMSDVPNALAAYRDYLRRGPDADNAAETSQRVAELELELERTGVQQLSVLTKPAGAMVRIDGASRGVTPWTGELPPGSHRLELQASGYKDSAQVFDLPAQHAIDVIFELVPIRSMAVELTPTRSVEASTEGGETNGPRWWTWAAFGGSAALLLGAGALELSRRDLEDDVENPRRDQFETTATHETMNSRMVMARAVLGMGLVVGAAGGLSLYWDLNQPEQTSPAVGLACDGEECRALARGHW